MTQSAAAQLGPLMIDVAGLTLDAMERERLCHPLVGGVVLFSRNYASREQLSALVADIHALRRPQLIVAVDQEGGRVQRWRDGFSLLPAAATIGGLYDRDPRAAVNLAKAAGQVIGRECAAVGVDLVFAPVVDLDWGVSQVIGDRAYHSDPNVVVELAAAMAAGLREAGVGAIAKHFPGHGGVALDTHSQPASDTRTAQLLFATDLKPYRGLLPSGVDGVMLAHVSYPALDPEPAGFSSFWIREMLRGRYRFEGLVFCDDLSMAAVTGYGDLDERVARVLRAGCDLAIVCNDPMAVDRCLASTRLRDEPIGASRRVRMLGAGRRDGLVLDDGRYTAAKAALEQLRA